VCPCEGFFIWEWMIGFHDLPFLFFVCCSRSSGQQSRSSTISTKWIGRMALLQQVTEAFILSLTEWRKPPKNTQLYIHIIALLKPVGCRISSVPALCGPPPTSSSSLYLCLRVLYWLPSASSPPSLGSYFFLPPIVPFLFHIHCLAIPMTPLTSASQHCISYHLTTSVTKPALDMFDATISPSNLHFLDFWATLKMEGSSCSEWLVAHNHQHVSISQKTKCQNVINKKWRTWAKMGG
jgi:hypothetical protein